MFRRGIYRDMASLDPELECHLPSHQEKTEAAKKAASLHQLIDEKEVDLKAASCGFIHAFNFFSKILESRKLEKDMLRMFLESLDEYVEKLFLFNWQTLGNSQRFCAEIRKLQRAKTKFTFTQNQQEFMQAVKDALESIEEALPPAIQSRKDDIFLSCVNEIISRRNQQFSCTLL